MSKPNIIKFHRKFEKPIIDGVKTSTIRMNFDGTSGDIFECFIKKYNIESIGKLRIKHVQRIRFDEINNEKAHTEGYLHEDLVKDELKNFYSNLNLSRSSLLYYITFEYIDTKPLKVATTTNCRTFTGGKK